MTKPVDLVDLPLVTSSASENAQLPLMQASLKCNRAEAERAAEEIVNCFGDCPSPKDPQEYYDRLVTIFETYPKLVVDKALHPRFGIPGQLKWVPKAAEIVTVCDALLAEHNDEVAQNWPKQNPRALSEPERERTAEEKARINAMVAKVHQLEKAVEHYMIRPKNPAHEAPSEALQRDRMRQNPVLTAKTPEGRFVSRTTRGDLRASSMFRTMLKQFNGAGTTTEPDEEQGTS